MREIEYRKMKLFIDTFCNTNRTPVSKDHNDTIDYIANELGVAPLEFGAGSRCLAWEIPKAWTVQEAQLMDKNRKVLIDFDDNPLHLWAHSISYKGKVTLDELKKHLLYNEDKPDWIPYHYRNQYTYGVQDWGFCMRYNDYCKLKDDEYYVNIATTLDDSINMKIIEYTVGENSNNAYLFAAHTCHPGMATDGITNVAVLMALINRLKSRRLKNSYKFIFGPEFYAAAAYLSSISDQEVKALKGTVYLDMLGNGQPICWQDSFWGDSYIDKVVKNVLTNNEASTKQYKYRKLWGNDETFYNGPGFLIPSVGIGGDKFDEYHFDKDNANFVNYNQLCNSVDIVEKIINILENDYKPQLKYKGPLFLSKYNLYWDSVKYPDHYSMIESCQILADGERSILDICELLGADFEFIYQFFNAVENIKDL